MTTPESHAAPPRPPQSDGDDRIRGVNQIVRSLAAEFEAKNILPGDRAALRQEKRGPAFWKIAVHYLEPAEVMAGRSYCSAEEMERRWAAIIAGLARHPASHSTGRRLGVVLAEADIAEARVLRLARAHGDSLCRTVRAMAHQLAGSGFRLDHADVAQLILSDGAPWEDEVRRRLCLDYYRTQVKVSRDSQREEES